MVQAASVKAATHQHSVMRMRRTTKKARRMLRITPFLSKETLGIYNYEGHGGFYKRRFVEPP